MAVLKWWNRSLGVDALLEAIGEGQSIRPDPDGEKIDTLVHRNASANLGRGCRMSENYVGLANRLTMDWVRGLTSDSSFVVSGAGAWALLAAPARGAHGVARAELENAVGPNQKQRRWR